MQVGARKRALKGRDLLQTTFRLILVDFYSIGLEWIRFRIRFCFSGFSVIVGLQEYLASLDHLRGSRCASQVHYLDEPCGDYVESAVNVVRC